MSLPRRVLHGTTYFITRRVIGRRYLLRPDPETMRLVLYSLGLASKRYGIEVHALCVMSNHYHLIATDPEGLLPLFLQLFHRLVALGLQRQRRWREVVWEPNRQTSAVELLSDQAVIKKTVYLLRNPLTAGLVGRVEDWPGTIHRGALELERPPCFSGGRLPERVTLPFAALPSLEGEGELYPSVQAALCDEERGEPTGRPLGVSRALRVSPEAAPKTKEDRWGLSPMLAAVTREVLVSGVAAIRAFRTAYREAVLALRRGALTAFPQGTWQLVRQYGLPLVSG